MNSLERAARPEHFTRVLQASSDMHVGWGVLGGHGIALVLVSENPFLALVVQLVLVGLVCNLEDEAARRLVCVAQVGVDAESKKRPIPKAWGMCGPSRGAKTRLVSSPSRR
jgi:hypothetical protein